jgi:hypothetical protein
MQLFIIGQKQWSSMRILQEKAFGHPLAII